MRYKSKAINLLLLITIANFFFAGKGVFANPVIYSSAFEEQTSADIYQKVIYAFMEPSIYEVLEDYYLPPINYERHDVKVSSIERPIGKGSFYFQIKLEVHLYTGPYDKIGIEHITLETAGSRFRALAYKHEEGFDFHRDENIGLIAENIPKWPENISEVQMYHDLAMLLLSPAIDQAIMSYYGRYYTTDPWDHQVLELTMPKEEGKPFCIMKLKVIPYTGPHNSVGIDQITLSIDEGPTVNIEKFDHLEGYEGQFRIDESDLGTIVDQVLSYCSHFLFSL